MATLRGSSSATAAGVVDQDDITIAVPSGTTDGDLVVILVGKDSSGTTGNTTSVAPIGNGGGTWSTVFRSGAGTGTTQAHTKIVTGTSEPANYTVTNEGSFGSDLDLVLACMVFTPLTGKSFGTPTAGGGGDATNPYNIIGTNFSGSAVVAFMVTRQGKNVSFLSDSDFTEIAEITGGAGSPGSWISGAYSYQLGGNSWATEEDNADAEPYRWIYAYAPEVGGASAYVHPRRQLTTVRM